ncbi:MAG: hypothetical protein JWN34_380 [Bryobacterales bacterium]|nr:hypothetical protein [Bryobacterales bacterium]
MGFSLQAFFKDLERIIDDNQRSATEKYDALVRCIADAYHYAADCGQVDR